MKAPSTRVFLGCVAGALSILVFHQTTLQIFFWLGWAPLAAFRTAQVPPFHAPLVASITFWGAIYGGVFGLALPWIKGTALAPGHGGRPVRDDPILVRVPAADGASCGAGLALWPILRSFIAYQMWGFGLTPLLPMLLPRLLRGSAEPPLVRQSPFGLTPDRV